MEEGENCVNAVSHGPIRAKYSSHDLHLNFNSVKVKKCDNPLRNQHFHDPE